MPQRVLHTGFILALSVVLVFRVGALFGLLEFLTEAANQGRFVGFFGGRTFGVLQSVV